MTEVLQLQHTCETQTQPEAMTAAQMVHLPGTSPVTAALTARYHSLANAADIVSAAQRHLQKQVRVYTSPARSLCYSMPVACRIRAHTQLFDASWFGISGAFMFASSPPYCPLRRVERMHCDPSYDVQPPLGVMLLNLFNTRFQVQHRVRVMTGTMSCLCRRTDHAILRPPGMSASVRTATRRPS